MQNLTAQYVGINKHSVPFFNAISSLVSKGETVLAAIAIERKLFFVTRYYLRFMDPRNKDALVDPEKER
jgi:hypothetical protein